MHVLIQLPVMDSLQETFEKPIHATLSNYWLRPWRKFVLRRQAVYRDEKDKVVTPLG